MRSAAVLTAPRHTTATGLGWRFIHDEARQGADNMALDHALAACLGPREGVVRLYEWSRPTVSFGRHEPSAGLYSIERARAMGVEFVRRPTGGRAVLHRGELTYAVVAPPRALGGARDAYRSINRALADALRALGAPAALAEGGEAASLAAGPCFSAPAAGEVVADGRKLVGSAQARVDGAFLQHGSVNVRGDQRELFALADRPDPKEPFSTLADFLGDVSIDDVAEAVSGSLRSRLGGQWISDDYRPRELSVARRLMTDRYGRDAWTWRR